MSFPDILLFTYPRTRDCVQAPTACDGVPGASGSSPFCTIQCSQVSPRAYHVSNYASSKGIPVSVRQLLLLSFATYGLMSVQLAQNGFKRI